MMEVKGDAMLAGWYGVHVRMSLRIRKLELGGGGSATEWWLHGLACAAREGRCIRKEEGEGEALRCDARCGIDVRH